MQQNLSVGSVPSHYPLRASVESELAQALLACSRVKQGGRTQSEINAGKSLQQGKVKVTPRSILQHLGVALRHGKISEARVVVLVLSAWVERFAPRLPADYNGLTLRETDLQGQIDALQIRRAQGDRSVPVCRQLAVLWKEYARVTAVIAEMDTASGLGAAA